MAQIDREHYLLARIQGEGSDPSVSFFRGIYFSDRSASQVVEEGIGRRSA
jgi:hypothetical protein